MQNVPFTEQLINGFLEFQVLGNYLEQSSQATAASGPLMCFVQSAYDFYNAVSLYMMKNSYLISENTLMS
jgi:hypothetical protein